MAKKFYESGHCKYCGEFTRTKCDSCQAFICEEHTNEVEAPNSKFKTFKLCKDCLKKGKKPKHPTQINMEAVDAPFPDES